MEQGYTNTGLRAKVQSYIDIEEPNVLVFIIVGLLKDYLEEQSEENGSEYPIERIPESVMRAMTDRAQALLQDYQFIVREDTIEELRSEIKEEILQSEAIAAIRSGTAWWKGLLVNIGAFLITTIIVAVVGAALFLPSTTDIIIEMIRAGQNP